MGLNLSNRQIASELGLNKDDVQGMTKQLRQGIECAQSEPVLSGEVEADEVYITAGPQRSTRCGAKKGRPARRRRLKGARGRGTLAKEKPPILGLIQRSGELVLRMLENVQQQTIEPIIRGCASAGTRFYTDEYDIDRRLPEWGYDDHHSVCHSRVNIPAMRTRWHSRDEDALAPNIQCVQRGTLEDRVALILTFSPGRFADVGAMAWRAAKPHRREVASRLGSHGGPTPRPRPSSLPVAAATCYTVLAAPSRRSWRR